MATITIGGRPSPEGGTDQAGFKHGNAGPTSEYDLFLGVAVSPTNTVRVRFGVSSLAENTEYFIGNESYVGNDGNTWVFTPGARARSRFNALMAHRGVELAAGRGFTIPEVLFV
jgi:hypothetical protein